MHVSPSTTRRKNRWQLKREAGIALSKRLLAGKERARLARPPPEYPPIVDPREPFLRITVETATGTERWEVYPGKRRAHGVTVNGDLLVLDGRRRHSLSQIHAELRRRAAMVERGLRLPLASR